MANKKPLIGDNGKIKQIADADNLLLPSMTITDGNTKTIDISTDLALSTHNHALSNLSDINDIGITDGQTLAWDSTTSKFIPATLSGGGTPPAVYSEYGFNCSGLTGSNNTTASNIIDYIIINTTIANATDVGDMTFAVGSTGGCASAAYGWKAGGRNSDNSTIRNNIEYIDMAVTTQNGTDGGDLIQALQGVTGMNGYNGYNYYIGGNDNTNYRNYIQYVDNTVSSANCVSYGSLTWSAFFMASVSDISYGFAAGGYNGSNTYNIINYLNNTINSGSGTDRGDLTQSRGGLIGVSGSSYGFYCGGALDGSNSYAKVNTIDYIQYITTVTNAVDRGDLTVSRTYSNGLFHSDIGVITGGYSSSALNIMDYIDLTLTTGNASDRGDLTVSRWRGAGCSG